MGLHDDIEAERKAATPHAEEVKKFRRYARGRHKGTLNAQQKRVLRSLVGNLFCDNVAGRILSELRNRLRLARFEVDGQGQAAEAVLAYLQELWTLQSVSAMANSVHWATLRDGNHGVSLKYAERPDGTGRVILRRELWWNGKYGLWIAYDDNAQPKYAVKDWTDGKDEYRIVYEPDRLRRFIKNGEGWQPHSLESDPEGTNGVIPWTVNGQPDGEPIGIPVVHFKNVQVPQDPEGENAKDEPDPLYGSSELDGGLLGLQDEVNDVHRDITAAARYAGYGMLYGTGVDPQYDENGEEVPYRPEPGGFFESSNPDARFGRIDPSEITPLRDTLKVKLEAMSRMSSVPMFAIQNEWPSGEALIRAEMPLIDKVETIAASIGPAWGSLMHKATRLYNVFGGGDLDEDLMIGAVFEPAQRRDALTRAQVARAVSRFVSRQEVLRKLGYSPEQIENILEELEEEETTTDIQRRQLAEEFGVEL